MQIPNPDAVFASLAGNPGMATLSWNLSSSRLKWGQQIQLACSPVGSSPAPSGDVRPLIRFPSKGDVTLRCTFHCLSVFPPASRATPLLPLQPHSPHLILERHLPPGHAWDTLHSACRLSLADLPGHSFIIPGPLCTTLMCLQPLSEPVTLTGSTQTFLCPHRLLFNSQVRQRLDLLCTNL